MVYILHLKIKKVKKKKSGFVTVQSKDEKNSKIPFNYWTKADYDSNIIVLFVVKNCNKIGCFLLKYHFFSKF